MGTCTSKKKPKENQDIPETEDVWKKRPEEPISTPVETGLYNFRREGPLITELKSVLPVRNVAENATTPTYAKGIKMADDSSSGSHGFVTPLSTPPVRRVQHPVFKVATPPPSRRVVEPETNKISSPVLRRVKKQSEVVPPSPPPRYKELFQSESQRPEPLEVKRNEEAPELPPRRNRLGSNKLSSPSLTRRTENKKEYLNTPLSKPKEDQTNVTEPKNNETQIRCENCNSPVLLRKVDRAPTPPPRKNQTNNNIISAPHGSPSVRRAYPVFKIDTPPPSRKVVETNKEPTEAQFIAEKPTIIKNVESSSSSQFELPKSQVTPSKEADSTRPIYSAISKPPKPADATPSEPIVRRKPRDTDESLVLRDDSKYLVRKQKTLSMEIEEENLRNYLKEHAGKSSATMNVLPGPVLVKQLTMPSPVRAVLTDVPPPSPSSLDILEEEEDVENEMEETPQDRKSKEMDEFNDSVCQRLSQLLETKEIVKKESVSSELDSDVNLKKNGSDVLSDKTKMDSVSGMVLNEAVPPPPEYFDEFSLDLINNNNQGNFAIEPNDNTSNRMLAKNESVPDSSEILNIPMLSPPRNKFNYKEYCQNKKQTSKGIQQKINLISESNASSSREEPDGISDKVVIEESIVPISIKRRSYEPYSESRQSELLCDVIQSYAKPEESDIEKIMEEPVVSKGTVKLEEKKKKSSSLDRKPSKLDQSLKKLFEVPVKEDTYDKLLPLESFLDDVMDQPLQSEATLPFDPFDLEERLKNRRVLGGRQSVTRTESDIDISEPGDEWKDDISSDSNQADDEDEVESGEVVFSKSYPDTRRYSQRRQGRGVVYDASVQQGTFQDDDDFSDNDYDDVEDYEVDEEADNSDEDLWIDEKDIEKHEVDPVMFGADYYPMDPPRDAGDVAYNSARRQMHEIHSHLLNLRDQMEYLADESENSNLKPSRCSGVSLEKKL